MQDQITISFKGIDGVFIQKTLFSSIGLIVALLIPLLLLAPEAIEDGALLLVMMPLIGWMFAAALFSSVQYSLTLSSTGIAVAVAQGNFMIRTGKKFFFSWDTIASFDIDTEDDNRYFQLRLKKGGLSPRWQKITYSESGITDEYLRSLFTSFSHQFNGPSYIAPERKSLWTTAFARWAAVVMVIAMFGLLGLFIALDVPMGGWEWLRVVAIAIMVATYVARVWRANKR